MEELLITLFLIGIAVFGFIIDPLSNSDRRQQSQRRIGAHRPQRHQQVIGDLGQQQHQQVIEEPRAQQRQQENIFGTLGRRIIAMTDSCYQSGRWHRSQGLPVLSTPLTSWQQQQQHWAA